MVSGAPSAICEPTSRWLCAITLISANKLVLCVQRRGGSDRKLLEVYVEELFLIPRSVQVQARRRAIEEPERFPWPKRRGIK